MNNILDLIKMIKNPQKFIIDYAKRNSNPVLNNLIQMAQQGNTQEVEKFARNMFKEQGQDYDEIMSMFK